MAGPLDELTGSTRHPFWYWTERDYAVRRDDFARNGFVIAVDELGRSWLAT
jgi:hypothetical protein